MRITLKTSSWLLVMALFLFSSCQWSPKKVTGLEPTAEQKATYRTQIEQAWTAFGYGDYEIAFVGFGKFRKDHPQTIYDTEARFGEARSLEEMEEWSLAQKIYEEIIAERLSSHPDLATLAMYYQSRAAEALGEEGKMLASLKGAEQNSAQLPEEIRIAALPARLATAYIKLGQTEEAKKYLALAKAGVEQLAAKQLPLSKIAQLYFEMGSLSTNQLSIENFQTHLDSLENNQIYLLRSIETGVSPWSDRSLTALQDQYLQIWNLAMNPPVQVGLDAGARERQKTEARGRWAGEIARVVELLKNSQRVIELNFSPQETQLREFVANVEKEIRGVLSDPRTALPLTAESEKIRAFNRRSKTKNRAKPILEAQPTVSDPNLKNGDN